MKPAFAVLGLNGLLLGSMAIYFQLQSMDLSRFRFSDYLTRDPTIPGWWSIVGAPLIVGAVYVVIAVVCLIVSPPPKATFAVAAVCLLLGAALCLLNIGIGLFAIILCVPLFVRAFPRQATTHG